MAGPVQDPREIYTAEESLKMMTSVRLIVAVSVPAGDTEISNAWRTANNVREVTSIVNLTNTGAYIAYAVVSAPTTYITEYFAAGQEKLRRVAVLRGSGNGTTVTKVGLCQT